MTSTRRNFLGAAAGVSLAAPLMAHQTPSAPAKGISPNDKIHLALIGCGGMGQGDAKTSTSTGLTKIVAACDCYDGRLEHMKEVYGRDIFTTKDYQDILGRKDIDAVIIGTPDHWHQPITIAALKAGKDVYCEKPMVHSVDEGHAVIDAQKQSNRILQIGSQRVSSLVYAKAKELFQQGAIGELNMVEAWWDRNSSVGAWEYTVPLDADTQTCDWDRFQGDSPKRDWDPLRFFRWRCYRDYGTGVAGDLFVHLFSGLHFITGSMGPNRVFATGGLRFWKDGREVPDVMLGLFDYPKTAHLPAFNLVLRVNFVSGGPENSGVRFIGSKGIMTVGRTVTLNSVPEEQDPGLSIGTFAQKTQEECRKEYFARYPRSHSNPAYRPSPASLPADKNEVFAPPRSYSDHYDHHLNWAHAIRSRKPVVEDGAFGFRAAGPALLSNISYFDKKIVHWDPMAMKITEA
jgi:predicted dehydrogenase